VYPMDLTMDPPTNQPSQIPSWLIIEWYFSFPLIIMINIIDIYK